VSVALPAEARGFQGSRAGIVSRSVAAVIDFGVAVVAAFVLVLIRSVWSFFTSGGTSLRIEWPSRLGLSSLVWVVLFLYLAWGWGRTGKTIGKRVLGLTVVTTGGGRLPAWLAIVRAALYAVFPVGLLWSAVSARQRSVQDLLLRTAVVYDWRRSRRRQPA
jgi:uncharacterized RDD family membrane protein YckC